VIARLITMVAAAGWISAAPHQSRASTTPRRHVVEISGMKFTPSVLEIHRGDTVTWINRDLVPHTATAEKGSAFDSGTMLGGDSASVVLREGGEYLCRLHPVMTGRVVVKPGL
jgi:plastocyanin